MKKVILLLAILIISMMSVNAADIDVKSNVVTKEIYPGEVTTVSFTIKNNQLADDLIKIEADQFAIAPFGKYFKDVYKQTQLLDISAQQSKVVTFEVSLLDNIKPEETYGMNFIIKSQRNPDLIIKHPVSIKVISPPELIKIESEFPPLLVPGEEAEFMITFSNTANLYLDSVDLFINSDLFSKTYEETFFQAPYTLEKTLSFKLDPATQPGTYPLAIRAFVGKELRGKMITSFEVVKNPEVQTKVDTTSGFLTRYTLITKTNEGNVGVDDTYEMPVSAVQRWMTKFSPEPNKVENGKAEWIFPIQPSEVVKLDIKTDYRPLFFSLIVLLIIVILLVYWARTGVSIKKGVFKVTDSKGGVSDLKVLLHIKNNTGNIVKNIKIVDIIPDLLKLSKEEFGTLKPAKVQKGATSYRLVWDIDVLEKGEERIISYKVNAGLHIIGQIMLPPALMKYKVGRKGKTLKSNKLIFMTKNQEQENN